METCVDLLLLILGCFLMPLCRCDHIPFCPVVLEGQPFSWSCNVPSDTKFVIWNLNSSGQVKAISRCSVVANRDCETDLYGWAIQNQFHDGSYTSTISLNRTTLDHRDSQLTCSSWDASSDRTSLLESCKMAVHIKGDTENCTVSLRPDDGIDLSCISTNVYPGVVCQYIERVNSSFNRLGLMTRKTRKIVDLSRHLYEDVCSLVVYHTRPGVYLYDFAFQPDFPTCINCVYKVHSTSGPFSVQLKPVVTVNQSKATLCHSKSQVKFTCQVTWMETAPKFSLFLNNEELKGLTLEKVKYGNDSNSYSTFSASVSFEVTKELHRSLMLCNVSYLNQNDTVPVEKRNVSLSDTKYLVLTWPPPTPPSFSRGDFKLSKSLDIKKGDNATIVCSAQGGEPLVESISVVCKHGEVIFLTNTTSPNKVSVTIYGNSTFNNSKCICTAHHQLQHCYSSVTEIQITVIPLGIRTIDLKGKLEDKIYYIVASIVFLVMLPIVIFFICKVCRLKDSEYYGNFYSNSFRDRFRASLRRRAPPAPPLPPPRIPPRPDLILSSPPVADSSTVHNSSSSSEVWVNDPSLEVAEDGRVLFKNVRKSKKTPKTHSNSADDSGYIPMYPSKNPKADRNVETSSTSGATSCSTSSSNSGTNDTESRLLLPGARKQSSSKPTLNRAPSSEDSPNLVSLGFHPPTPRPCTAKRLKRNHYVECPAEWADKRLTGLFEYTSSSSEDGSTDVTDV
ncbi:uncharacterized protein LOC106069059 [Biomphalaria glabrata]|uniref:Uncharacterized protein LOC106069059 n=1 Tax=Biomphalaria glabrata TaxID=6526 RepID=A0A9W2Z810_BIOGL|nr:uncharacterized protein LOC106069059 [Biomphalaria glabrata]XP_055871105.1 uncharacterized protein LOC106069059 [Biomphalaria glabrata]XP_055871106.1 uncharacterized protein LOC106069059 [Biomphalaria glabrata]XP_055871107.1 uncharacterized protein LOC106069059 [Biomphalaria glabrata]